MKDLVSSAGKIFGEESNDRLLARSNNHRAKLKGIEGRISEYDVADMRERQGNKCRYCKNPLQGKQTTIDHIVSFDKGGLNEPENCVLACLPCNASKGNKDQKEFIATRV